MRGQFYHFPLGDLWLLPPADGLFPFTDALEPGLGKVGFSYRFRLAMDAQLFLTLSLGSLTKLSADMCLCVCVDKNEAGLFSNTGD